jgi:hypothetical protein
MAEDTCPRCGRPYPFGGPREVVPGRQCFACDERDAAPAPGQLWGSAADICQVCGATIGFGVRWLHIRLCDRCASTKH